MRTRIIPILLLKNESLVKTVKFKNFNYIGDPCNTIRIFNELEVDELILLDITASRENKEPNYSLLTDIASECFMPLTYGGAVRSVEQARKILNIGFEKISLNSSAVKDPKLISQLANHFGNQAIIVSVDIKKDIFGKQTVRSLGGLNNTKKDPVSWVKEVESMGAGEILLTSIDKEGTWEGFDINLIKEVASNISIPVIAHGGAGTLEHISDVVINGHASAVALGSMIVYQKKDYGVLINFPDQKKIEEILK